MNYHSISPKQTAEAFGTDISRGLSSEEAVRLREKYGENRITGKKKPGLAARFLEQFKDFMVIVLLIAAGVSFAAALRGHDRSEFLEPVIIIGIVLLNATMGVFQESKAEKALEALRDMAAPLAKVFRDGTLQTLPAAEVVPGDVIILEAGDYVPADARLVESSSLKSEESALTGESVPSEKDADAHVPENAPIGDRHNMVYSGCSISYGRGRAVVTSTGMDTQMGKIALLLDSEEEEPTPLQKQLSSLGKTLGIAALAICAVIFVIGIVNGMPLTEIFLSSVSLAVAAIPEGLPAIVTIVLAMGVRRMVEKNAIVRRLPAVETLGSASVICSDKTGTLTQNRMTLTEIYSAAGAEFVQNSDELSVAGQSLLQFGVLCCDGRVEERDGKLVSIGDPTETSIVYAGHMKGLFASELGREFPRVHEVPFDSDRKLMTTVNMIGGKPVAIVKGAYDRLAPLCKTAPDEHAQEAVRTMSSRALRVLAVAYKTLDRVPEVDTAPELLESELEFIGLLGMIDPPRPEAARAVAVCKSAGIKTVMITGDHVLTASAIAAELGILEADDIAMTGEELGRLSDDELADVVERCSVYARVSPQDKIRIVKAWQKKGHVVSMTGDGVNDAPALKAADIGCAMGITGTDVAKGAANMILTDDNFATIVHAVKEGRGIFDNIQKAVKFLVSCNIGEIFTVLISMLFWHQAPLAAIHILWINLVTDSLPALALGVEPVSDDVMLRAPAAKNRSIFTGKVFVELFFQGLMFGLLTVGAYFIGSGNFGHSGGQTMAFLTLATLQLFHAFNERSERSLFKIGLFSNKAMLWAFAASSCLILIVAGIPTVAAVFGLIMLPAKFYAMVLGLAFVPVIVTEIYKNINQSLKAAKI